MTTSTEPIRKRITVPLSPERAFELFTSGIDRWWPLASHSVAGADAATAVFEPQLDGRVYERTSDGSEHEWGTVLAWEPPRRVVFSWHPGRDRPSAQRVEVVFESEGAGAVVSLTHSDWGLLGAEAESTRRGYDTGWDFVLGERYRDAASRR